MQTVIQYLSCCQDRYPSYLDSVDDVEVDVVLSDVCLNGSGLSSSSTVHWQLSRNELAGYNVLNHIVLVDVA